MSESKSSSRSQPPGRTADTRPTRAPPHAREGAPGRVVRGRRRRSAQGASRRRRCGDGSRCSHSQPLLQPTHVEIGGYHLPRLADEHAAFATEPLPDADLQTTPTLGDAETFQVAKRSRGRTTRRGRRSGPPPRALRCRRDSWSRSRGYGDIGRSRRGRARSERGVETSRSTARASALRPSCSSSANRSIARSCARAPRGSDRPGHRSTAVAGNWPGTQGALGAGLGGMSARVGNHRFGELDAVRL